jgi:peptidoglycan/xylan/chitin deacetylase (PgdA/CDA1 family)
MRRRTVAVAAAVTGLLLSACGGNESDNADQPPAVVDIPTAAASPSPSASTAPVGSSVDAASVNANELGKVPVMMYHVVKPSPAGDYDQSPEEFKAELERLYKENYRPITAVDFVEGKIDIPAGTHPVVLTFDDSTTSQAQIGADGQPTPDSALGIMEAFEKTYPDWKSTATFYVNNGSFADEKVIPWLVNNGYEVGSHTATHANLKQLQDSGVQKEIATNVAYIQSLAPGYEVKTFARPLGIAPVNRALMETGSFEGKSYKFIGVMLVGSNPSKSAFDTTFDGLAIPRIRSGRGEQQLDSGYWLTQMAKNPSGIYTSDGDPNKISFPKAKEAELAAKWKDKANPYEPAGATSTTAPTSPTGTGAASTPSASAGTTTAPAVGSTPSATASTTPTP